jgi:lipopolysaccharide export LptBFGC system permease protein LptF
VPSLAFSQIRQALGREPHRNVFWRAGVSRRYAGDLLGGIARDVVVVLAAVEGIFLSEFMISELLPRVLEHGGTLLDVVVLLLYAVPDGLYLALPVALLIATYLAFLRRREASEFTVIAGMGYGGRLLVSLAALAGIGGFVAATAITGFIEPHARYLFRKTIFDIAIEELRSGEIAAGKFHVFGEMAVFASRGRLGNRASGVFVHEHLDGDRNRIIMAGRSLGLSAEGGRKAILLDDATILTFARTERTGECEGCTVAPRLAPANVVDLNRFFVGAPELPLPQTSGRAVGASGEATTPELLAQADTAAERLGQRLLRAALCFFAPLLALAAVAVTGPKTLLLALPGAGALLLGGTFFGPRLVERLAGMGTWPTLGAVFAAMLVASALAVAVVLRREPQLINPARVRL